MKGKILIKAILIIILTLSLVAINSCMFGTVQATGDFMQGADDFISNGSTGDSPINTNELQAMSDLLYNTLLIVAIVIAVIVGLVIGIQFMTGSVAQKAKIKETLIPYVAGCIVIFGAFGIWKLVVNILSQL